jgi:hypothetical protein
MDSTGILHTSYSQNPMSASLIGRSGPHAELISDLDNWCRVAFISSSRLFEFQPKKLPPSVKRLLQHYRHKAEITIAEHHVRSDIVKR